jgi:uncharacterized membrane protein
MWQIVRNYSLTFIVFIGIDMVWLLLISKNLYADKLGYLMAAKVNFFAAIIFYLIFIAGLLFFVVYPAFQRNSWTFALLAGAFFGLVTYATYDLTNLATIRDWPLLITVIDLIWGSFISAITATLSYFLIQKLF